MHGSEGTVDPNGSGSVKVVVHKLALPTLAGSRSKYYISLRCGVKTCYTDSLPFNCELEFQETFVFQWAKEFQHISLLVTAMEVSANSIAGCSLVTFCGNIDKEWLDLKSKDNSSTTGRIQLSITYQKEDNLALRNQPPPVLISPSKKRTSLAFEEPNSSSPLCLIALKLFVVLWFSALVFLLVSSHFQASQSSRRFFILDPKDQTCLSFENSQANFQMCQVEAGITSMFVSLEGEGDDKGKFALAVDIDQASTPSLCLDKKGKDVILAACNSARHRWEFVEGKIIYDQSYCLFKKGKYALIQKCKGTEFENFQLIGMHNSGNSYLLEKL